MSRTIPPTWLAGVTLVALVAAAPVHAAVTDGIDVRLSTATPVVHGDADVVVRVTITNTNRAPVIVHPWQLPSSQLDGSLFQVTRDGKPVPYTGPLVKRGTPGPRDVLRLDAGASISYDVELTAAYDLNENGRYDIVYRSRGAASGYATPVLQSDTLYVWLEGRTPAPAAAAPAAAAAVAAAGSLGYSGNCSASQKTTLQQAFASATTYATNALAYLTSNTPSTARKRYIKWFGTAGTTNWNIAKTHYTAIRDAFTTKAVVLDCSCKQSGVYAYVYPTQPYKIYVCNAFWSAPLTGTDSKGGTLVHEMSHFNVVASTDDWAYGQSAAASLAISNPAKALDNADSHEYFAENTPVLP